MRIVNALQFAWIGIAFGFPFKESWFYNGDTRIKHKSDEMCASFREMSLSTDHILKGTDAEAEDFPYLGALALQDSYGVINQYRCAASLISDRFILTAAHCLENQTAVHVRFGTLSPEDVDDEEPVIIGIEETFIHPNYTMRPELRNDIALLKLNRTIVEDFLIPACLYADSNLSPILLATRVPTYMRNMCYSGYKNDQNTFNGSAQLEDDHLCTLEKCIASSGGPLELPFGRRRYIVGIISPVSNPCKMESAMKYARVSYFIGWIESIVWPQ